MAVKPSEKEILDFRKYLKKKGFTVDGISKDVYYLYMQYGYICLFIEYTKKGEFKGIRAFLSLGWENSTCSRYYFRNYYELGSVRKLDRDYVETCTLTSTSVMIAISEMFGKIESITRTLKKVLKR